MPGVTAWHHGPIAPCQATLPADAEQRAGSRYTQLCQILPPGDKNYGGYLFEVTFIIVVMMLLYLQSPLIIYRDNGRRDQPILGLAF